MLSSLSRALLPDSVLHQEMRCHGPKAPEQISEQQYGLHVHKREGTRLWCNWLHTVIHSAHGPGDVVKSRHIQEPRAISHARLTLRLLKTHS